MTLTAPEVLPPSVDRTTGAPSSISGHPGACSRCRAQLHPDAYEPELRAGRAGYRCHNGHREYQDVPRVVDPEEARIDAILEAWKEARSANGRNRPPCDTCGLPIRYSIASAKRHPQCRAEHDKARLATRRKGGKGGRPPVWTRDQAMAMVAQWNSGAKTTAMIEAWGMPSQEHVRATLGNVVRRWPDLGPLVPRRMRP